MMVRFLAVVASLLVCLTICKGGCVEKFEDVYSVDCSYLDLIEVPTYEISRDVQSLDMANNKLTKLKRSVWKYYKSLETLYLTANEIDTIEPNALSDLKNLRNLDLSNNRLQHIPSTIFSDISLEALNLRGNAELGLPSDTAFLVSQSLISLDLSSCGLNSLTSQTFSLLPQLVYLDLRSNNLNMASLQTFEYLENLKALDLRNNKWNCDCEIVQVLNWISARRLNKNLLIEHSPIKCLDKGIYRTLWTADSMNKRCQMDTVGSGYMKILEERKKFVLEENEISITRKQTSPETSSGSYEFHLRNIQAVLFICAFVVMLVVSVLIAVKAANRITSRLSSRSDCYKKSLTGKNYSLSQEVLLPSSICHDIKKGTNT